MPYPWIRAWLKTSAHSTLLQERSGLPRKQGEILYRWTVPDMLIAGISYAHQDGNPSNAWSEVVLFGFSITDETNGSELDDTKVPLIRVLR